MALLALVVIGLQAAALSKQAGQFFKYPLAAADQVAGRADADRLTDYSPLYLGLHTSIRRLTEDPLPILQAIQILCVALASALLFLLLRRHVGLPLAFGGSVGFVFLRSVSIYGHLFEPEALILLLVVALAYLAGRRDLPGSAGAGVALALAILARPSFLPLAALVPLAMLAEPREGRRTGARTAVFLLPVATALLLVASAAGPGGPRVPPPIMNPGTVLHDGNNPLSRGKGAAYPELVANLASEHPSEGDYHHVAYRLLARRGSGMELDAAGVNRYWGGKARDFLLEEPGHALRLLLRKVRFIFHSYRWHDVRIAENADRFLSGTAWPCLPLAPVSALAVAGLFLGMPRWREYAVFYALFMVQGGVMVVSYATDRQRIALLPVMVFFALVAVASMVRARGRSLPALLGALLLVVPFSVESDLMRDNKRSWESLQESRNRVAVAVPAIGRGELRLSRQMVAEAIALVPRAVDWLRPVRLSTGPKGLIEDALEAFPAVRGGSSTDRFDHAMLLIEGGRLNEAEGILVPLDRDRAVFDRATGRAAEPAYHLGRIAALRGDRPGATALMERALKRSPGDPDILAALAVLTDDPIHDARLARYTDPGDRLLALGLAHFRLGSPERAVEPLSELASLVPEYRRVRFYLAAALGAAGREEEAAQMALAAIEAAPSPVLLEERIVPILSAWVARHSGECDPLRRAGSALRVYGRYDEALRLFAEGARTGCPGAAEGVEALRGLMEESK